MTKQEKVMKGLECCSEPGRNCNMTCPYYDDNQCEATLIADAYTAMKALEPREITKDEWQAWKRSKKRDPLCYMYVDKDTTFWMLEPEDIYENKYLMGQIVIFNGKPTDEQRENVQTRGMI